MKFFIIDSQHQVLTLQNRVVFEAEPNLPHVLLVLKSFGLAISIEDLGAPVGHQCVCVDEQTQLKSLAFLISDRKTFVAASQCFWQPLSEATESAEFWHLYCDMMLGRYRPTSKKLDVFCFGDSPQMASRLAHLVIKGQKRLTTGLVATHEKLGEPIPQSGQQSIITDGCGIPLALIKNTQIRLCCMSEVTQKEALLEGEGDLTLTDWYNNHFLYFEREAASFDLEFSGDSKVFLMEFELLQVFQK